MIQVIRCTRGLESTGHLGIERFLNEVRAGDQFCRTEQRGFNISNPIILPIRGCSSDPARVVRGCITILVVNVIIRSPGFVIIKCYIIPRSFTYSFWPSETSPQRCVSGLGPFGIPPAGAFTSLKGLLLGEAAFLQPLIFSYDIQCSSGLTSDASDRMRDRLSVSLIPIIS